MHRTADENYMCMQAASRCLISIRGLHCLRTHLRRSRAANRRRLRPTSGMFDWIVHAMQCKPSEAFNAINGKER